MYEGRVVRSLTDLSDADRRRYWEEVQKTHLKAPLEAVDLMFLLEGVTRAFTHQLVRQRTAVYAQESLRFAVKEELVARPGPGIAADGAASEAWSAAMEMAWAGYQTLLDMGVPAEDARGVLPHDTLTRVIWKTNLRNLAEHAGNRLCTQAQFEWRTVLAGVVECVRGFGWQESGGWCGWQGPVIADSGLFLPVCFGLGCCPFTASFDRGCTIRERVDAGLFGEIDRSEWMLDPTAGWVR